MTTTEIKGMHLADGFYYGMAHLGYTSQDPLNAVSRTFTKEDGPLSFTVKVHPQESILKVTLKVYNDVQKLVEYRWKIGSTEKRVLVQYIIANAAPILIGFPLDTEGRANLANVIQDEIWHRYRSGKDVDIQPFMDEDTPGFLYKVNIAEIIDMFTMMTGEHVAEEDIPKVEDTIRSLHGTASYAGKGAGNYSFTNEALIEFFARMMEPVYTARNEYFIVVAGWADCKNYARP